MQRPSCFVFVKEKGRTRKIAAVQFQVPSLMIALPARNLTFASKAIRFIEQTRANPAFRDKNLGRGRYRHMPRKLVDLSHSFRQTKVYLEKDGEFDDRYFLSVKTAGLSSVTFEISGPLLDAAIAGLREVVEDYCDERPKE